MMPIPPSDRLDLSACGWMAMRIALWVVLFCCAASITMLVLSLGALLLHAAGVL